MKDFLLYIRDMLQLMLSPKKGWEDVSADGFDPAVLFRTGFLPLVLLAAAAGMLQWAYHTDVSWWIWVERSLVDLLKLIATYYIASFVFTLYLPTCVDGGYNDTKCMTFITYGTGMIALITLIINCMPMTFSVLYMMPVYALYVLWRGLHYMSVSFNGVGTFIMLIIFSLILPAYLIQALFNLLLPAV
ncbi:MAG: hypothetical protein J6C77_00200 [Muribaculaceae bacterium]|nr:hypothetical protein [Muribaculaceae bacterium]